MMGKDMWRPEDSSRVLAAQRMLRDGATVDEAASAAGCRSVVAFSARFRRETGMTPARYLQLHSAGLCRWCTYTPIGRMRIIASADAVLCVERMEAADAENTCARPPAAAERLAAAAAEELAAYFARERRAFDLPLAPEGTAFQQAVWTQLARIPYGETRTYAEIAVAAGRAGACRAVGMANHSNPLLILVPCHRVIGADGSLTGYAEGLEVKRYLLRLEGNA